MSRVTSPTTGSIKFGGRVASLLEVGTGFNGEMTGRENIYLNGAILGMTKKEITSKLDEIIDFSGCERYIDTPVKRYSSGMYVRLAFAVAAFLEPEILIIDEVLAVGDAEFQKKAIGKMQDISRTGGRTVLFVSHNMAAVQSLCTKAILLEKGRIIASGEVESILEKYLLSNNNEEIYKVKNENFVVEINLKKIIDFQENIKIDISIDSKIDGEQDIFIDFAILNKLEEFVIHYRMNYDIQSIKIKNGNNAFSFDVDNPGLVLGDYTFVFYIYDQLGKVLFWVENSSKFQISNLYGVLNANAHFKSHIIPKVILKNN